MVGIELKQIILDESQWNMIEWFYTLFSHSIVYRKSQNFKELIFYVKGNSYKYLEYEKVYMLVKEYSLFDINSKLMNS